MSKEAENFIAQILPDVLTAARKAHLPPSVLIAAAGLETHWGEKMPGNNMFGIQAPGGWNGKQHVWKTTEYENGETVEHHTAFRAYGHWKESIKDYVDFLQKQEKRPGQKLYQNVLAAKDGFTAADALQKAGYATEPDYAYQMKRIIRQYRLDDLDRLPETERVPGAATLCNEISSCKPLDHSVKGIAIDIEIANRRQAFDLLNWPREKVDTIPGGIRGNLALAILQSHTTILREKSVEITPAILQTSNGSPCRAATGAAIFVAAPRLSVDYYFLPESG